MANPKLAELPAIGPGGPSSINGVPDLEKVLAVRPQVIFISYMEKMNAEALQKKIGIPVIVLTHGRFATFDSRIYDSLRIAGKILDAGDRAEKVISFIERARKDLENRTRDVPIAEKPDVYIGGIGFKGLHGIESTDAGYVPFEWVGAKNSAKKICFHRQGNAPEMESGHHIHRRRRPEARYRRLSKKARVLQGFKGGKEREGLYPCAVQQLRDKHLNGHS